MRPTRKCEFCGKTFVPRSGMQKYCSEECQAEAKRLRKKRQQDLINGIEPIMDLQHQEYLTFSKAALLMGCTRQYIYKLVANGKLKASRLSSRMAFVRKTDIEKMFEGNPYKRVIPASKSKPCQKTKAEKPTQNQESTKGKEENEVLDYYSGEEVMSIYKVKKSWLYTSAKRNQIPMCRIAGKNYYSKRHIDEFFGTAVDIHSITEWVTADDVEDVFSMSKSAVRAYAYRHKIPTKREYGRTYYSKEHLEELRRTDLMNDDNYYTTKQVQQLYGLTSANICHIVRVRHISKVKVGVKNLLLKTDVERAMAERAAKGL
ncbi:helix-turn-helix domain-containing protein [Prevotella histicola]|jgi:bacteriophage lambda ninG protein|uniref:helix-turn-helix domain-containing protein n=1 Tax=Prevotella histicola TaxID=470565 RepID=UPI003C711906